MNKKILFTIGILLIALISILMLKPFCPKTCPSYVPPSPDFCSGGKIIYQKDYLCSCPLPPKCEINIPKEFKSQYNEINRWLEERLIEWKPTEYKNMSFCAQHIIASERMLIKDATLDLPYLEMLKETGIDCVRLSIYPYNYEKYKGRYDDLINKIKESNLKLMVAYMVGDLPKGSINSFEEYKEIEINFTKMFIAKHKPDYYAVVTEPITMEKRLKLGVRVSDGQWIELVKKTIDLVKSINPKIKTMAVVNTEEGQLELAKKFALIDNLDIVAFQLYNPLSLEMAEETIDFAETQGKDTWITETWLGPGEKVETWQGPKTANPYFNYPFMEPLNAKWIKVIIYYAQKHKMDGISPFFTNLFVAYPGTNSLKIAIDKSVEALKNNERTKPFYAYKEIIEEIRKKSLQPSQIALQVSSVLKAINTYGWHPRIPGAVVPYYHRKTHKQNTNHDPVQCLHTLRAFSLFRSKYPNADFEHGDAIALLIDHVKNDFASVNSYKGYIYFDLIFIYETSGNSDFQNLAFDFAKQVYTNYYSSSLSTIYDVRYNNYVTFYAVLSAAALIEAGYRFSNPTWIAAGENTLTHIHSNAFDSFLISYNATGDALYQDWAVELLDKLNNNTLGLWDLKQGGFYYAVDSTGKVENHYKTTRANVLFLKAYHMANQYLSGVYADQEAALKEIVLNKMYDSEFNGYFYRLTSNWQVIEEYHTISKQEV